MFFFLSLKLISIGTCTYKHISIVHWNIGTLEHVHINIYIYMVHWNIGTLEHVHIHIIVH